MASRIDDAELHTIDGHHILNQVTRGAVDVAHDGLILVEQLVEQCRLTHISLTDDSHGDAFLDGLPRFEAGSQLGDALVYVQGKVVQLGAVSKLEILVVGEVKLKLQQTRQLEQMVVKLFEFVAEMAPHLTQRQVMRRLIVGRNQVSHSFGLTQVHLIVEEGAHGELAMVSLTTSSLNERTDDAAGYISTAVAANLYPILPRIGVRRTPKTHHHVINLMAVYRMQHAIV